MVNKAIPEPVIIINIGDTDENADWIKKGKGHATELAIHEELARKYRELEEAEANARQ